jgi:hypothetical protein
VICQECGRSRSPLGSVVADELIFPVDDIYLASGAINVTGRLRGPIRRGTTADYIVCDRAGRAVWRSSGRHRLDWPAMPAGSELRLTSTLTISGVT